MDPSLAPVLPPDVLGRVLDAAPSIARRVRESLEPISSSRAAIREVLRGQDAIHTLPEGGSVYGLWAADSGFLVQHLAAGDLAAGLAVAVRGGRDVEPALTHHRSWSDFIPHSADTEHVARGIAMGYEAVLLREAIPDPTTDEHVGIVDGSHASIAAAVATAMTVDDDDLLNDFREQMASADILAAVEHVLTADNVIACPKADSSTDLHTGLARAGLIPENIRKVPDKMLASLLLEPGEALTHPAPKVRWERAYATLARAHPTTSSARDRLRTAIETMAATAPRVYHAKPAGASIALRVEVKGTVDDFTAVDMLGAVCDDCDAPYTQEPLIQYLADMFAKTVSVAADVQMEVARLDLARDSGYDLLEYVLRTYRT